MAKIKDFDMFRGDDVFIDFVIYDSTGNVQNLSGCLLWMTGKNLDTDTDPGVFQLESDSGGITITDSPNGACTAHIPASTTDGFTVKKKLKYDLQIKDSVGNIETVVKGVITVKLDTTRETS